MKQWTVDAFASRAFAGNPACVIAPLDAWPDVAWMQAMAAENNQAETAFLRRTGQADTFDLRWFTPTMEVDLCGHATLAAAHVLFAEMNLKVERLMMQTRSGPLFVTRREGGDYEMDFPADPPRRCDPPPGLAEALGVQPVEVWAGRYLVAILDTASDVRTLNPDIRALSALQGEASEPGQVIVAAADETGTFDVVDRFFAPGCGVDEDPATGSAHCILAPLYAERLGRSVVRFHQAFPGRGGDIETEMAGDRVRLRGQAVTTIESCLRSLPAA